MSANRSGGWLAFIAFLACLIPKTGYGVELEQTIWGFGQAPPGEQITLLSVLLRNDSPEAFDADVQIAPNLGALGVGTKLVERVFISPNSSRWVQFYPYRVSHQTEWVLNCGSRQTFDLPSINSAPQYGEPVPKPIAAWLQAEGSASSVRGAFPTFPAELFPPSVAGANGLQIAVLNEAPRWDQPRREAFLGWIYRGGTVHLYQGSDGAFPQFTGELQTLNGDAPEQSIGQGKLFRHPQGIGGAKLEDLVPPPPANTQGQQNDFSYRYYGTNNDEVFRRLRELVSPQHQWPLIWLASIVYLLIIFPGGYLLGKARRDFRLVMGLQVGSALLFTLLFSIIGARGYNETSRNLAVAVARPVAEGKWDVAAWNNVFATSGGDYKISFPRRGSIFGIGGESGLSLRGTINNGVDGQYLVDIPPFSSCTFLTRTVVDLPRIEAQVTAWDPENPSSLSIAVNSGWPTEATRAFAFLGNTQYLMNHKEGRLTVQSVTPPNQQETFANRGWRGNSLPARNPQEDAGEWLNKQLLELEDAIATYAARRRVLEGDLLEGKAILLIPAPMSETCFPDSGVSGKPAGRILYTLDLPLPGR